MFPWIPLFTSLPPSLDTTSGTSLEYITSQWATSHLYPRPWPSPQEASAAKLPELLFLKLRSYHVPPGLTPSTCTPQLARGPLPHALSLSDPDWERPRKLMRQPFPPLPLLPNSPGAKFSSLVSESRVCSCFLVLPLGSSVNFPRWTNVFPLPFSVTPALTTLHSPHSLTLDFKIQKALENQNFSHNPSGSKI